MALMIVELIPCFVQGSSASIEVLKIDKLNDWRGRSLAEISLLNSLDTYQRKHQAIVHIDDLEEARKLFKELRALAPEAEIREGETEDTIYQQFDFEGHHFFDAIKVLRGKMLLECSSARLRRRLRKYLNVGKL